MSFYSSQIKKYKKVLSLPLKQQHTLVVGSQIHFLIHILDFSIQIQNPRYTLNPPPPPPPQAQKTHKFPLRKPRGQNEGQKTILNLKNGPKKRKNSIFDTW